MIKATTTALLLMLCLLVGGMMLAMGESVLRVLLLLAGVIVAAAGTNRILTRSRARQNKPDDFAVTFADFANLSRSDWIQLLLVQAAGIGLMAIALVAFGGGA